MQIREHDTSNDGENKDDTYTDRNAVFIGSGGKFHNKLGASFFFGIVQRTKTTDDFDTVLGGDLSFGSHVYAHGNLTTTLYAHSSTCPSGNVAQDPDNRRVQWWGNTRTSRRAACMEPTQVHDCLPPTDNCATGRTDRFRRSTTTDRPADQQRNTVREKWRKADVRRMRTRAGNCTGRRNTTRTRILRERRRGRPAITDGGRLSFQSHHTPPTIVFRERRFYRSRFVGHKAIGER